jgi:glycosyltransferase involved in cell wall biosynthesis
LWIGRICPEKGVHIALEVAHRTGLPAIIAGPVHPFREHQLYFSERVQPLLDDQRQYVGPIGLEQKIELLGQASCLLIPSLVAETSSLVAMEAISSGTPVIAFRSGALPEVIDHGATGFIVDSQDEMVIALERIGDISPDICREVARCRFDSARMVRDYLSLYESLLP